MEKRKYLSRIAFIGLMIVLLFVVLSTATYAWFSANNVVGAGVISFTSSSTDVGGFLTIGKSKTTTETEITFDKTPKINPMIPTIDGIVGDTKLGQFKQFHKTFEGLNGAGQWVAMLNGTETNPLLLAVGGQDYFYINNLAPDFDIKVKLDYSVTGELANKLHVAMFMGENEDDSVLMGIISGSGVIHYGKINVDEVVANKPAMQNAYKPTGAITFTVPSNKSVCIRLVVWLDGVDMKNENGGKNTSFSLAFSEEK